ncbi:uncharacterized protein [Nicotiana sylvestris]|uniref:uncharacterized protein n=1 Tax=Nicotiana sylvestris TaxID=4096 RepID=UPI00388CDAF2
MYGRYIIAQPKRQKLDEFVLLFEDQVYVFALKACKIQRICYIAKGIKFQSQAPDLTTWPNGLFICSSNHAMLSKAAKEYCCLCRFTYEGSLQVLDLVTTVVTTTISLLHMILRKNPKV